MLTFPIQRLPILLATLFGILILVFAFIRLAPGEPDPSVLRAGEVPGAPQSEASFDRLLRYRMRRNLDLALLFDPAPLDRDAHAEHHLERALPSGRTASDERGQGLARAALRLHGSAAIPTMLRRLDALSEDAVAAADRRFIRAQLNRLGWLLEPDGEPSRLGGLSWEEDELERRLGLIADRLARGAGALDPLELRSAERHGTLLLPRLFALLDGELGGAARARLLAFIEACREGRPPRIASRPASPPKTDVELARSEDDARSWWRERGFRFRRVAGLESIGASFLRTQFATWILSALRFDFGRDLEGRRIGEQLWQRLGVTLPLMAAAIALVFLGAVPIGVWLATTRRRQGPRAVSAALYALYCAPEFWLALILLAVFAEPGPLPIFAPSWSTHELPAGADLLESLGLTLGRAVLPVLALGLPALAYLVRQTRASMLESLGEDYIRTAAAKGLGRRRIIWCHAWRNSLMPLITIGGAVLPALVGGSLVVESVFEIPGMGRYGYEGLLRRDYNVVMAVTALSGVLTLLGLLLSDWAYRWADPRISHERG